MALSALGPPLPGGVLGRAAQPRGTCLQRGAIFKAAGRPGRLVPGSAGLLGHVGYHDGELPIAAAPHPGFSVEVGRVPLGWSAKGSCFSVPSQGLFCAKSFRGGGKEPACETHFCCVSGAAAHPSPRAVGGGSCLPQQPLSKPRGFLSLAMRQAGSGLSPALSH